MDDDCIVLLFDFYFIWFTRRNIHRRRLCLTQPYRSLIFSLPIGRRVKYITIIVVKYYYMKAVQSFRVYTLLKHQYCLQFIFLYHFILITHYITKWHIKSLLLPYFFLSIRANTHSMVKNKNFIFSSTNFINSHTVTCTFLRSKITAKLW